MKRCTEGTAITRAKLGEQRCFWSRRIYEHLCRCGHSTVTLARELGVTRQAISNTISGKSHSPRVLDALHALGVPEKYLFDPREAAHRPETIPTRRVA